MLPEGIQVHVTLDRENYLVGETAIAVVRVINDSPIAQRVPPLPTLSGLLAIEDDAGRSLRRSGTFVRQLDGTALELAPGDTLLTEFDLCIDRAEDCQCLNERSRAVVVRTPSGLTGMAEITVDPGDAADRRVGTLLARSRGDRLTRAERVQVADELGAAVETASSPRLVPFAMFERMRQCQLLGRRDVARDLGMQLVDRYPDDPRIVRAALVRLYNLLDLGEMRAYLTVLRNGESEAGRAADRMLSNVALWPVPPQPPTG